MIPEPAAVNKRPATSSLACVARLSGRKMRQGPQDLPPARGTMATVVCSAYNNQLESSLRLSGHEWGSAVQTLDYTNKEQNEFTGLMLLEFWKNFVLDV